MINLLKAIKKHALKILILAAVIIVVVIVAISCNIKMGQVNTELSISDKKSGIRHMTVEIPKKSFEKLINVTWTEFSTAVKNNCPSQMEVKTEDTNTGYKLEFDLKFNSLDEYMAKASQVIGRNVSVTIETPDNVFARGVNIREDFTSVELLGWLPATAAALGQMNPDSAGRLLAAGTTTVIYDQRSYQDIDGSIEINDIEALSINSITINTLVKSDRTFDREILIEIPEESMNENGEQIKAYLEGNAIKGAMTSWKEKSKKHTFTVKVEDKSIDVIKTLTSLLFDDERCAIYYQDSANDDNFLDIVMNYNESISFKAFSSDGEGEIPVKYNFAIEDLDTSTVSLVVDGNKRENKTVENIKEYQTLIDESVNSIKVGLSMSRKYEVNHILSTTTVNGNDNISRDVVFIVSELPTEFEQEIIAEKLKNATEEYAFLKTQMIDGKFCFTLSVEGTEAGVSNDFYKIFGKGGAVKYVEAGGTFEYDENIDFINFPFVRDDVFLTYTLNIKGMNIDEDSFKLTATTVKDITIKGETAVCNLYGAGLSLSIQGSADSGMSAKTRNILLGAGAALIAAGAGGFFAFTRLRKKKELY